MNVGGYADLEVVHDPLDSITEYFDQFRVQHSKEYYNIEGENSQVYSLGKSLFIGHNGYTVSQMNLTLRQFNCKIIQRTSSSPDQTSVATTRLLCREGSVFGLSYS